MQIQIWWWPALQHFQPYPQVVGLPTGREFFCGFFSSNIRSAARTLPNDTEGWPGADPGSGPGFPLQQPAGILVGGWQAGFINPRSWGLGGRPFHEYVVSEGCSRQLQLQRSQHPADSHPHSRMRPPIWAGAPDDPRSGLRVIEARWLDGGGGGAQGATPSAGVAGGALMTLPQMRPGCTLRRPGCTLRRTARRPSGRGCSLAAQQ